MWISTQAAVGVGGARGHCSCFEKLGSSGPLGPQAPKRESYDAIKGSTTAWLGQRSLRRGRGKGGGALFFATSCQPAAYDNRGPSARVGQIIEKSPCCAVDVVVVVDKTNPRHGGFGFLLA